jgi:hypothetical protein
MRIREIPKIALIVMMAQLAAGCAVVEVAMVGAGKSATTEDTGFLKSYQGLAPVVDPAYPRLPDFSYVSPQVRMSAYKKVLMPDFTSIQPDVSKLRGLQVRQYKSIKQDMPSQIANTFDGSAFRQVTRISDRIDPKDTAAIKKLPADAVLMGNIKELFSLGGENNAGLTAIQVEYKLIDIRSGEEVVTAIHRSTTDLDKVPMAQVSVLTSLFNKAKASEKSASSIDPSSTPDSTQTTSPKPATAKGKRPAPPPKSGS